MFLTEAQGFIILSTRCGMDMKKKEGHMNRQEEAQIKKWSRDLSQEVPLRFLWTEDHRSREIAQFCKDLERLAPQVQVKKEEGDPKELPGVSAGRGITYHGVPLGTELQPFLEALSGAGITASPGSEKEKFRLERIDLPVLLRLFVTTHCHFCPAMVRQLIPLPAANDSIRLAIVDGVLFPEAAKSEKIQSVPTLLLDTLFRWTGSVSLNELLEVLGNRDPASLGPSSLENMLNEGDASRLANLMLKRKMVFPAFIDLLAHRKWSVRLGAMVAMEEMAEIDPNLALQVAAPLWQKFENADEQTKGDIIYVLGEVAGRNLVPSMEKVLAGDYGGEIKEAAEEALEKIVQRG